MDGRTLVRDEPPRIAVAVAEPLLLQGYGRQWVSLDAESLVMTPSGIMDFAVFGDGTKGPVTRHAQVIIVRPGNDFRWEFRPESYPVPGGFAFGRTVLGGRQLVSQLVRVDGEKDWFSAMWRASGRETPEFWLSRRFSFTPEKATRVAAEYREPWPECLDPDARNSVFLPRDCLDGFLKRSETVFDFEREIPGDVAGAESPSILVRPRFQPDMKRLAGELMEDMRLQFWR